MTDAWYNGNEGVEALDILAWPEATVARPFKGGLWPIELRRGGTERAEFELQAISLTLRCMYGEESVEGIRG